MNLKELTANFDRAALDRINEAVKAKEFEVLNLIGSPEIKVDGHTICVWDHPSYYLQSFGHTISLYGDKATEEDKGIHNYLSKIGLPEDIKKLQEDIEEAQAKLDKMKADFNEKSKKPQGSPE